MLERTDCGGLAMQVSEWAISEFVGPEGLRQIEADWRRLYEAMPDKSVYHTYEFRQAEATHLCVEPSEFRCLTFADADYVRAIVRLAGRAHSTGTETRVPRRPPTRATIVCADDDVCQRVVPALVEYLRRAQGGSSLLVVGPLPQSSTIWLGLNGIRPSEYYAHPEHGQDVFDCTNSYDELMSKLSKVFRSNLRRVGKKLNALSGVRYTVVRTVPELLVAYESFLKLEASGWKGTAPDGYATLRSPAQVSFYRDVAEGLGRLGQCEINELHAEGKCIAAQFCVITGDQYAILKIAYDEEYKRVAPGLLLLQHTLERCCTDSTIDRLNFISDLPWFQHWRPDVIPMLQAHIVVKRPVGRLRLEFIRFRFGYGRQMVRWLRSKLSRPHR